MAITEGDKILLAAGFQEPARVRRSFDLLIRLALKMLGADEGSLLKYDKKENVLKFVCTIGGGIPEVLEGKIVPVGKGITGMAALTREIQTGTRENGMFNVPDDGAPHSVIAAPVMLDKELIGVMTAVSFDLGKAFSTEDCRNFSIAAQLGAVLLAHERQIDNYRSKSMSKLTEQGNAEVEAAQKTIGWLQRHPDKTENILKILSLLGDI